MAASVQPDDLEERTFRQMFDASADACFVLQRLPDGDYAYVAINGAAETFLRVRLKDVYGVPLSKMLPPDLAGYFAMRCRQAEEARAPITYDEEVRLPSGNSYFSTSLIPLLDAQGRVTRLAGICRDVTEWRRAELSRRESHRLEGLGLLAGGIAHDFNNLLGIALANLELLRADLAPKGEQASMFDAVTEALQTGASLTRQMLAYAGKGKVVTEVLDLRRLVHGMRALLVASVPKSVPLELQLPEHECLLEADAAQLQQVIMNLVGNATDAIGDRPGRVTISVQRCELEPDVGHAHTSQDAPAARQVVLTVADTGCGMTDEVRQRMFDPFFTTKANGRGLGLSAIQGILRSHHATMTVESTLGQGSVFRLHFPETDKARQPSLSSPKRHDPRSLAKLQVLLADDESQLRVLARRLASRHGIDLTCVPDGRDAVRAFEQEPTRWDLLILDVTMAHMGGVEAYERIAAIRPIPTLFLSGYTREALPSSALCEGRNRFLSKPFGIDALLDEIVALVNPVAVGGT